VAQALGSASSPRAIVAYDTFATDPLSVYLPGIPWTEPNGPVGVGEVDVVGYRWQTMPAALPSGVRLIATRRVDGNVVARFALDRPWQLTRAEIGARASGLLGPGPAGAPVLVQRTSGAG
jgi:hypothetical protein